MKKHVKSFTYEPKIKAVLKGECTQTIRRFDPDKGGVEKGDQILFHGWAGKPRHSDWSWRKRVVVNQVLTMITMGDYFTLSTAFCRISPDTEIMQNPRSYNWDSKEADEIAALDFIAPPKGIALRDILTSINPGNSYFQIITWNPHKQATLTVHIDNGTMLGVPEVEFEGPTDEVKLACKYLSQN